MSQELTAIVLRNEVLVYDGIVGGESIKRPQQAKTAKHSVSLLTFSTAITKLLGDAIKFVRPARPGTLCLKQDSS